MLLTQVHLKARRDASKKRPDSITPRESLTLMVLILLKTWGEWVPPHTSGTT